jgi:hypothetical protein
VDRGVIGTFLEEFLGQFLFGVHNPFKSSDLSRDSMETIILEKVRILSDFKFDELYSNLYFVFCFSVLKNTIICVDGRITKFL